MKKVICIALATLMLVSLFSFSVSAASNLEMSITNNKTWSTKYVHCKMKTTLLGKTKSGYVSVFNNCYNGVNLDIKMNYNGKTIWSKNNAIKPGYTVQFYLGNDHTYYDLGFRTSKNVYRNGSAVAKITVSKPSNCTIAIKEGKY